MEEATHTCKPATGRGRARAPGRPRAWKSGHQGAPQHPRRSVSSANAGGPLAAASGQHTLSARQSSWNSAVVRASTLAGRLVSQPGKSLHRYECLHLIRSGDQNCRCRTLYAVRRIAVSPVSGASILCLHGHTAVRLFRGRPLYFSGWSRCMQSTLFCRADRNRNKRMHVDRNTTYTHEHARCHRTPKLPSWTSRLCA